MRTRYTVLVLAVTALLNVACADEHDSPPVSTVVPDRTSERAPDNRVVAKNETPSSKSSATTVKETGSTRGMVELLTEPYRDAKRAGQLPANTAVTISERRGGWLRVSAQGKHGWARLHQITSGSGPVTGKSADGVTLLKNVGETGRSGSQGIVATTGIRGLSAQELKTAKPDPKAVEQLDVYSANESGAREFARQGNLKSQNVPYLKSE